MRQAQQAQSILEATKTDAEQLFTQLDSTALGLSSAKAAERLKQIGPNVIARKKPAPWWLQLLKTFNSPFNYLLLLLGIVSFLSGNIPSGIMIVVMILLSVILRFLQEYRSSRAAERLQAMVSSRASVWRDGQCQELPIEQLVPGDILQLAAGDLIPADVRLLEVNGLHVNQAPLTGETFPVEKSVQLSADAEREPLEQPNLCFMGSSVVSGMGKAIVVVTGNKTYFGNMAIKIMENEPPTSFEKGLNSLSWLLIQFILGMVLIILLLNGLDKRDWFTAFLFALSVGVGLTPEMLPMIVTTNLSRGALALSGKRVIVKRLAAIQNLGALDILCTDKTGTLTQNRIILYKHLDLHGHESVDVLQAAYLNSHFQSGIKSLLDDAILKHAQEDDKLQVERNYTKVAEIPFDFERRRLSIVVASGETHTLICKGAVEEVLAVCNRILDKSREYPLTPAVMNQVHDSIARLNQDGFRVIAVAHKKMPVSQSRYTVADEQDLTLLGTIAFLDPPKETTATAIAELERLGIELKILTGDNELVTRKICQVVNLPVKGVVLGHEIDSLSEPELAERAEMATIFAKLNPGQKERIIQALRKKDHVVGFLGDGINDAPALKAADIGLSVDNAVDIAKESADMILMEQSLMVLKDGVIEGRKVFGNIIKYIRMTTSSNFGNVFSMVGASLLLPFLPMLPIQILTQNLLYDFSQTAIPFDRVDEEFLNKPHRWAIPNFERFMVVFGPISSLFDYATFAILWFVFGANTLEKQNLFHTGWFMEGLLSQTLIVHLIRTRKIPFIQSWAAPQLLFATTLVMLIGLYLPYSPLAKALGFVIPPTPYFLWLLGILLGYFLLTQLLKVWFIRKFGYD